MRSNHPEKENALPTVWGLTMDDAQRPSEREMRDNSRSRSAILHVLRKVDAGRRLADVLYRYTVLPPSICIRRLCVGRLEELGVAEMSVAAPLTRLLTEPVFQFP